MGVGVVECNSAWQRLWGEVAGAAKGLEGVK